MTIIFLYGPPAVGKLTVGAELAKLTNFKLFHNHVAGNVATELFDWGSPGYIDLKRSIWEITFKTAVRHQLPGLIFTYVYKKPTNTPYVTKLIKQLIRFGIKIKFVQLTCRLDELKKRIDTESRRKLNKLTDLDRFEHYRAGSDIFSPLPLKPNFVVDTTQTSPKKAALMIQEYYQL